MNRTPTSRKLKPPACDACKARRVLCHPQPNGLPCPRCVEKEILCRTTYVPRGRPRKNPIPSNVVPSEVPSAEEQSLAGATTPSDKSDAVGESSLVLRARPTLEAFSMDLPCEIVQHLFECFTHFPQYRLPLFRKCGLKTALSSAAWNIDLLPPEARVLAYCICAQSSSMSFHPAIIGPGPKPESFSDRSVFFPGADLRIYGARRDSVFRALHQRALDLACETRIYLEASDYNAASCFILETLEESSTSSSRPWALAYISHIRTIAPSWTSTHAERRQNEASWAGFLMAEALLATLERKPILITHADQLLISGEEPPLLESVLESLRPIAHKGKKAAGQLVFSAIRPVLFHVTRLSRELYLKISGDHARRLPVSEASVINFISALAILQSIVSLCFTQIDLHADPTPLFLSGVRPVDLRSTEEENIRSCASAMSGGFTSLILALHREMEYRGTTDTCDTTQSQWELGRTALLRQQAHAMASAAVEDVARTLKLIPTPPHFMHVGWTGIHGWAQFCVDEADAIGRIPLGRVVAFECILNTLKAGSYSRIHAESSALIERMEAHLTIYKATDAFLNDEPALSDMTFPLDNSWMGMFSMDTGTVNIT
ncbi:hypothetical protein B0H11DRAFT_1843251 [Mycena galericulata]|nr:hypothetical protein B0H11DRAFT_1843251 [Mycena galericulata]